MTSRASSPLDPFMPDPDVRECFRRRVGAPPATGMAAARDCVMQSSPLVRAIFRAREKLMRATPRERLARGLVDEMRSLGWAVLRDEPRLLLCGAACRPWQADVVFEPIPAAEFALYRQDDRVKIAWSLQARSSGPEGCELFHETRVVATDEQARARFLRYWRWARFGIVPIRLLLLPAIGRAAERRHAAARPAATG